MKKVFQYLKNKCYLYPVYGYNFQSKEISDKMLKAVIENNSNGFVPLVCIRKN